MFFSSKVANTISAIRVGYISRHRFVTIPACNYTLSILDKLCGVGYISSYSVSKFGNKKTVTIILSYVFGRPAFGRVVLVSKPSKMYTISWRKTKHLLNFGSIIIISTSAGLLTAQEAYRLRIGGVVLLLLEW